jgi:hypothetical protein
MKPIVENREMLGEAKCRWAPSDRKWPVTLVGLPLDCAHPEPSHRHKLLPSGPHPVPSAAARPSIWQGELKVEIKPEPVKQFVSTQPGEVHNVTERSGHSQ